MELDIIAAKDFIAGKFRNAGDFDFIPDEQLEEIISALVAIDDEYLRKIAEDDSPYDEEYVYEHMLKSVSSKFSRYQTYLMRLVDVIWISWSNTLCPLTPLNGNNPPIAIRLFRINRSSSAAAAFSVR